MNLLARIISIRYYFYTFQIITVNIINEKHKEIMKMRAKRLKNFESNEYSDNNVIIMETNEENSQRNLSNLNENMKK
ncbi:hypothetical protein YYG_01553 [Plasmodium vinckei petteri]|uniref:Uncharacterized protein n=1 Tax=Plasmodium vinckei petteri TaxID=138298 RepID=W7AJ91_PLAVN|nr:hypothetical protein YYG_01553 [Plasmodium vinckei petteri]